MASIRRALVGLLLFLCPPSAQAQPQEQPVEATDLLKIRQLDDVTVSPERRHVAYTVKQAHQETDTTYTYRTHLYVVPTDGSAPPQQLTRGAQSASQPAWHPDGDRLAFVRPVDGTPQVFVLPFYGGEAYQLTDYEQGASQPEWGPDGERILFSAKLPHRVVREQQNRPPHWPSERPGRAPDETRSATPDPNGSLAEVRAWLAQNRRHADPRVFSRLDLQGERDLKPRSSYRHLFVQQAEPDAPARDLTPGFYSFSGGTWLPNGQQIVCSSALTQHRHPDRVRDRDLFLVDVDDGTRHRLLDMDGYAIYHPVTSPDGKHVAFLARALDDVGYAQTELGLYALDGNSAPDLLTRDFDRSVRAPQWDPNGWYLFFAAASEGGFPLYRLSPLGKIPTPEADTLAAHKTALDTLTADTTDTTNARTPLDTLAAASDSLAAPDTSSAPTSSVQQLTADTTGVRSYDLSSRSLFYVRTQASNPYELYTTTVQGTSPHRLTAHNADWLQNRSLSRMTRHTLTRGDSLTIDYWTMKPAAYDPDRTYPLLLEIHGGPMAMWGPGEATMWHEFQFLAGKGYGIVFANPRGSGGYGRAFKRANYRDWGTGPTSDVLAAADSAARLPWLDADRQVVTGGSYAGYLTAWIVAHTDRFQAAVAQRGVYDLATFLGEGNAWRLVPSHFGGYPWGADTTGYASELVNLPAPSDTSDTVRTSVFETLRRNSPLTYVDQINTPLLIMHSDEDLRTGVSQSEMLYKSLKLLDKPAEYVRYPDAGHDLSRTGNPKQRIDRLLRIWEFFERYVDHRPAMSAQR